MEQYRQSLAACVKHATDADSTRDPLSPGYAAGAYPAAEADERVKLASQIKDVLAKVPAADRVRWANRAANLVQSARERMKQSADWANTLRNETPDNLLEAPTSATGDQLARDREIVSRYLKAFNTFAADYARVRRIAGENADDAAIMHWLKSGTKNATATYKRLEAAKTMADAIAEQTILDPTLLVRVEKMKIDATQINQWMTAIDSYLEVAGKALGGLFSFGKKGAAETVAKQFNKPLTAQLAAAEIKRVIPAQPAEPPRSAKRHRRRNRRNIPAPRQRRRVASGIPQASRSSSSAQQARR